MWFDAPASDVAPDASPIEARTVAWLSAAFAFPLVIFALAWIEPLTRTAASGFGAG